MIRWYADNSELHGIWGAAIQDILLYGGLCVSEESRERLCGIMRTVKSGYDEDADFPLKWNFLGLRGYYQNLGKEQLYERLLQASTRWSESLERSLRLISPSSCRSFTGMVETGMLNGELGNALRDMCSLTLS